jgi:hypothetical protein
MCAATPRACSVRVDSSASWANATRCHVDFSGLKRFSCQVAAPGSVGGMLAAPLQGAVGMQGHSMARSTMYGMGGVHPVIEQRARLRSFRVKTAFSHSPQLQARGAAAHPACISVRTQLSQCRALSRDTTSCRRASTDGHAPPSCGHARELTSPEAHTPRQLRC